MARHRWKHDGGFGAHCPCGLYRFTCGTRHYVYYRDGADWYEEKAPPCARNEEHRSDTDEEQMQEMIHA